MFGCLYLIDNDLFQRLDSKMLFKCLFKLNLLWIFKKCLFGCLYYELFKLHAEMSSSYDYVRRASDDLNRYKLSGTVQHFIFLNFQIYVSFWNLWNNWCFVGLHNICFACVSLNKSHLSHVCVWIIIDLIEMDEFEEDFFGNRLHNYSSTLPKTLKTFNSSFDNAYNTFKNYKSPFESKCFLVQQKKKIKLKDRMKTRLHLHDI